MTVFDCPELPVESFDYSRSMLTLHISFYDVWCSRFHEPAIGYVLIGKQDASKIPFRPRTNETVLMLEEEGTGLRFWFHIPRRYIK